MMPAMNRFSLKPLADRLHAFGHFLKGVFERFFADHCPTNASAMAFTTVLAMVPLVTVTFSTLSMFPVFEHWAGDLESFVYENFVPATGDVVRARLSEFSEKTGRLTAVGLAMLIASALLLLVTVEETFNAIWRVKRGRRVVQRILAYWAMLTLGPVLIGASLSVTSYLVSSALSDPEVATARSVFLSWVPLLFEVLAFFLLYTVMPNRAVRLWHGLVGGLAAALLFEITKKGFTVFVLNVTSYEIIYGALATIPIFLIWVWLSWLVVLVGAEITAALGDRDLDADDPPGPD
ncbi:MAG: virulence factor BrkB family protein [Gammaproteobacteria bacterium]|nr:virulence factor BrkB family protein [Gammaproteobacteria bacterium]